MLNARVAFQREDTLSEVFPRPFPSDFQKQVHDSVEDYQELMTWNPEYSPEKKETVASENISAS